MISNINLTRRKCHHWGQKSPSKIEIKSGSKRIHFGIFCWQWFSALWHFVIHDLWLLLCVSRAKDKQKNLREFCFLLPTPRTLITTKTTWKRGLCDRPTYKVKKLQNIGWAALSSLVRRRPVPSSISDISIYLNYMMFLATQTTLFSVPGKLSPRQLGQGGRANDDGCWQRGLSQMQTLADE